MSVVLDTSRARELFDAGRSCRSIAAELGVAPSTVSRWARGEGLAFDRSQTAMAVRAHTIDLAEARVELAQKLMLSSFDALDELDGPYLVYNFGGRENVYTEHTLDSAPVDARVKVHALAKQAFDASSRIVERQPGGTEAAIGVLGEFAGALAIAAEQLRATPEED